MLYHAKYDVVFFIPILTLTLDFKCLDTRLFPIAVQMVLYCTHLFKHSQIRSLLPLLLTASPLLSKGIKLLAYTESLSQPPV